MATESTVVETACTLLRRLEGCVLTAYPDPATGGEPWTIGYGATGPGIRPGVTWTLEQAEADLMVRVAELVRKLRPLVRVPLPDGTIAALVSFTYNVGLDAFAKSTLLRRINAGDAVAAADEFAKWVRAGPHKCFQPLVRRRAIERKAYLDGLRAVAARPA